jgi:DNA-binding SARP family transcriptional activator
MDVPEQRAAANLRSALWRLRGLHLPVLAVTGSTLAIDAGVSVDFDRAMRAAAILNGADPPEEFFVLLYEELLPDEYEDWVLTARERYRNLRLHALERRCGTLCEQARYAEAVDIGLTVVSMDPLRETAHEAVIRAHLAENNRGEALRQYRAYAQLVGEELGIEPSPALTRLVQG